MWIACGIIPYGFLLYYLFTRTDIFKDNRVSIALDMVMEDRILKSLSVIAGLIVAVIGGPIMGVIMITFGSVYYAIDVINKN